MVDVVTTSVRCIRGSLSLFRHFPIFHPRHWSDRPPALVAGFDIWLNEAIFVCLQLEFNILRLHDRTILGFSDENCQDIFDKFEVSTFGYWGNYSGLVKTCCCYPVYASVRTLSWWAAIGAVFLNELFVCLFVFCLFSQKAATNKKCKDIMFVKADKADAKVSAHYSNPHAL